MSYAHEARLRALELAARPRATGADVRRYLRAGPAAAPAHVWPLLHRWRAFVGAAEADAGGAAAVELAGPGPGAG